MQRRNQFARDHLFQLKEALFDVFGDVEMTRTDDLPRWTSQVPSSIQYDCFDEHAINQLALQVYEIIGQTVNLDEVDWQIT